MQTATSWSRGDTFVKEDKDDGKKNAQRSSRAKNED